MLAEWVSTTLGEVAEFSSGGTPSKSYPGYWGGAIPWVSAKDMKRFRLDDTEDHITEDGAANGSRLVPSGTVLLLVRGMTLINDVPICIANRPMAFNQDVKALRPKTHVLGAFLPYLLIGNKDRLLSLVDLAGHGTGRLNSDELKAFDVLLPPLPEQRRIACILGALDDKIELNRRMNRTLEEMAQAIFKSWFIDFDGHDDLVESELGLIPRGWEVTELGSVTSYLRRGIQPKYCESGGVPVVNQKCIRHNRLDLGPARRHDQAQRSVDGRELQPGDVLVNSTGVGTLGRVAHVPVDLVGWICDSHVTVVRADPLRALPVWLGALLTRSQSLIESMGQGSTGQTELSRDRLSRLGLVLPPNANQRQFADIAEPMGAKMRLDELESATLTALRDTLLPKLISGEIRVPEAEAIVEEAL